MLEGMYSESKDSMNKVINHYQNEISIIRTGRASKDILDIVKVDYYGSSVPLNTIANITAPDGPPNARIPFSDFADAPNPNVEIDKPSSVSYLRNFSELILYFHSPL